MVVVPCSRLLRIVRKEVMTGSHDPTGSCATLKSKVPFFPSLVGRIHPNIPAQSNWKSFQILDSKVALHCSLFAQRPVRLFGCDGSPDWGLNGKGLNGNLDPPYPV